MGAALERAAAKIRKGLRDTSTGTRNAGRGDRFIGPVVRARRATGRSGLADVVAAHKWFRLAALKGHSDANVLRREVAEQISDEEIARAHRDARA